MSVRASIICIVLVGVVSSPSVFSQQATPAQQPDAKQSQSTESPNARAGKAGDLSTAQPSDGQDQTDQDKKKTHRGSIVAAPLPMVSPALGAGIVPVLGYIFPLSTHDKVSPPSVIGGAGLITDNGSNGFGVGAQLFMKENRFQVQGIFADGNLNYTLFGEGFLGGVAGVKLPLSQTGRVFFGEGMVNVGRKIFIGPRVWIGDSTVTIRRNSPPIIPLPDIGLHTELVSLGFVVNRDTRPNRFYPLSGSFVNFTSDFFSQGLGSKYTFESYRLTFSKYWSLSEHQVLAYNLFLCETGGKPPFYGNCIYGTNNQLRGYQAGQYLDRFMVATQLEYRLTLPKRFGLVGFGGLGGVVPGSKQLRFAHFLPDIGAGLRYELSTKYHVNLRLDVAQGNGSHTWAMGVGEAF